MRMHCAVYVTALCMRGSQAVIVWDQAKFGNLGLSSLTFYTP